MVFKLGSTGIPYGGGGVSLGIWVRDKGLASLPWPPLQWFYQFHIAGFLTVLMVNNNKQKKQNGNSWLKQPRRAPRRWCGRTHVPWRHRWPFSKVNDYPTGASGSAEASGDSKAWKELPTLWVVAVWFLRMQLTLPQFLFGEDKIPIQGRICFFPYRPIQTNGPLYPEEWVLKVCHHLPLSRISETILVQNLMSSWILTLTNPPELP